MFRWNLRWALTGALAMLTLALSAPAFAQGAMSQGNVIKSITLQTKDQKSLLVISGTLSPTSLKQYILTHNQARRQATLILPNALLDPDEITTPQINFPAGSLLQNVQLKEQINEKGADIAFVVQMVVNGRQNMGLKLIDPISETTMIFEILDSESFAESQIKEKTSKIIAKAKKKQQTLAIKRQRELAERRQKTLNKVKTSASEILRDFTKPSMMQISILNASGVVKRAYKLSVFLGNIKKRQIEETLGIKVDIVNVANYRNGKFDITTIYYRENFLKSALFLASLIPGEQKVLFMRNQEEKEGLDIVIYLGKDYR